LKRGLKGTQIFKILHIWKEKRIFTVHPILRQIFFSLKSSCWLFLDFLYLLQFLK
jgi:hypothetical protein